MKKIKKILASAISILLALSPVAAYADIYEPSGKNSTEIGQTLASGRDEKVEMGLVLTSSSKKTGLMKKGKYYYFYSGGKKAKRCWKSVKGKRYYFKANGRAAMGACKVKGKYYIFDSKGRLAKAKSKKTPKVVKAAGGIYLADSKGRAVKGWQVISGKLYHASASGKCATSKTYDKIPFTKYGYAKPANMRTKLMIKSVKVVSRVTNEKMTRTEKLNACWKYSTTLKFKSDMFPANGYDPNKMVSTPYKLKNGWQIELAYQTLSNEIGNCWGWVCSFCALAKVLGEDPYIIFDCGIHVSARIKDKYWDNVGNIVNGDAPYWPTRDDYTTKFW